MRLTSSPNRYPGRGFVLAIGAVPEGVHDDAARQVSRRTFPQRAPDLRIAVASAVVLDVDTDVEVTAHRVPT